jgi:methylthioribulose-1-phosphate dehydratase
MGAVTRGTQAIARALAETGQRFYARGWVFGTSGNFSAVASRRPLRLAITASGRDKRTLRPSDILTVDDEGRLASAKAPASRQGRPSAETLLHVTIVRLRNAGAVLHTHSVWSTMLSEAHADAGGLQIDGYEMLKGLDGVTTHEHREWIPILDNDQDIPRLSRVLESTLTRHADAHAVLLRRHGLYTWGATLADAERHVEILEFLFETLGRSAQARDRAASSGEAPKGARRRA